MGDLKKRKRKENSLIPSNTFKVNVSGFFLMPNFEPQVERNKAWQPFCGICRNRQAGLGVTRYIWWSNPDFWITSPSVCLPEIKASGLWTEPWGIFKVKVLGWPGGGGVESGSESESKSKLFWCKCLYSWKWLKIIYSNYVLFCYYILIFKKRWPKCRGCWDILHVASGMFKSFMFCVSVSTDQPTVSMEPISMVSIIHQRWR